MTRSVDASGDDSKPTISAQRTGGWDRKYRLTQGVFSKPVARRGGTGGGWKDYNALAAEINGETLGKGQDIRHWDFAPPPEYFEELFRVSRNQIIWGGNYFSLPPTRCFVVWDKPNISENFSMAMCEYAWCSFNANAKVIRMSPQGSCTGENRIHPCQKPVKLYEKLLTWYAKTGDRILDTHAGSGSSRIAAYNLGHDYVGYELDPVYFELQEKRFAEHTAQVSLFVGNQK